MAEIMKVLITKITSARFWVILLLAATLCALAWQVVNRFQENKELIALVVGQFIFICKDIIIKYFDRNDRSTHP